MSLQLPILNAINLNPPQPEEKQIDIIQEISDEKTKVLPFIILHSKELQPEELEIFKKFGKIAQFDDTYHRIDAEKLNFDYMFLDLHSKNARLFYGELDLEKYNVLAYINIYEKYNPNLTKEELQCDNIITSIPKPLTPFKEDFDKALLEKKIKKPNKIISFFSFCLNIFSLLKKE